MSAETAAVLAGIDAALEPWEAGEDAARWYADGGPDEFTEEEYGGMRGYAPTLVIFDEVNWDQAAAGLIAMHEAFAAAMQKCGDAICEFALSMHPIAAALDPKSHRCCRTCHPEAGPAVDGHEYHRRQKARGRRRRRLTHQSRRS